MDNRHSTQYALIPLQPMQRKFADLTSGDYTANQVYAMLISAMESYVEKHRYSQRRMNYE
jgi:hypothetical protein